MKARSIGYRLLDLSANVAVIAAVVLAGSTLWARGSIARRPEAVQYRPGDVAPRLPTVSYTQHRRTALLFVRSECHFCAESMNFYRHIAEAQRVSNGAFDFIVASSEPVAVTRQYLDRFGLRPNEIVLFDAQALHILGTPTLLVVDSTGHLSGGWLGKQPDSGEKAILKALGEPPL